MSSFFVDPNGSILYGNQAARTDYINSSYTPDDGGIINMYLPKEMYNQMMLHLKQEVAAIKGKYKGKSQTVVRNCITNKGFLEVGDTSVAKQILKDKFEPILIKVTRTVQSYISQFRDFFQEGTFNKIVYDRIMASACLLLCSNNGNSISKFISGNKLSKSEFLFGPLNSDMGYADENVSVPAGSFVLKIYTVDNESVRAMMPPPLGVNIEDLIKYKATIELRNQAAEEGAKEVEPKEKIQLDGSFYNISTAGDASYSSGKIPQSDSATSENYLHWQLNDEQKVLFRTNPRNQYMAMLLALIDYCHDFLDASGDRTADGFTTSNPTIRENSWGWVKALKIQATIGTNVVCVIKKSACPQEFKDFASTQIKNPNYERVLGAELLNTYKEFIKANGEHVILYTDSNREKTISNMEHFRDTIFDNEGVYIVFCPCNLFLTGEEDLTRGEEKNEIIRKFNEFISSEHAMRETVCCYYRGASTVILNGDTSKNTILYDAAKGRINSEKDNLLLKVSSINKSAQGDGLWNLLNTTYNYDNMRPLYGGGVIDDFSDNIDSKLEKNFKNKQFNHTPDPVYGPQYVRDCGSADALVESILGYNSTSYLGEQSSGVRARQAIFSGIMDPATGKETDALFKHPYNQKTQNKLNIEYKRYMQYLPIVQLPYSYIYIPAPGVANKLLLHSIVLIKMELNFDYYDFDSLKTKMMTVFSGDELNTDVADNDLGTFAKKRVLMNKVTFDVFINPGGEEIFDLNYCYTNEPSMSFSFLQIDKTPGVSGMCNLFMNYHYDRSTAKENHVKILKYFRGEDEYLPIAYSSKTWSICMMEISHFISSLTLTVSLKKDPYYKNIKKRILTRWGHTKKNEKSVVGAGNSSLWKKLRELNVKSNMYSPMQYGYILGTTFKTFGDKFRFIDGHIHGNIVGTCDSFLLRILIVAGARGIYSYSDSLTCCGPVPLRMGEPVQQREQQFPDLPNLFQIDLFETISSVDYDEVELCDIEQWNPFRVKKAIVYCKKNSGDADYRIVTQDLLYKLHFCIILSILKIYNMTNSISDGSKVIILGSADSIITNIQILKSKLNLLHGIMQTGQKRPLNLNIHLYSLLTTLWENYEDISINSGNSSVFRDIYNWHAPMLSNQEFISKNLNELYRHALSRLNIYVSTRDMMRISGNWIDIPGTEDLNYEKMVKIFGLDLTTDGGMLMYDVFNPEITTPTYHRHISQFQRAVQLMDTIREQILRSGQADTGGGRIQRGSGVMVKKTVKQDVDPVILHANGEKVALPNNSTHIIPSIVSDEYLMRDDEASQKTLGEFPNARINTALYDYHLLEELNLLDTNTKYDIGWSEKGPNNQSYNNWRQHLIPYNESSSMSEINDFLHFYHICRTTDMKTTKHPFVKNIIKTGKIIIDILAQPIFYDAELEDIDGYMVRINRYLLDLLEKKRILETSIEYQNIEEKMYSGQNSILFEPLKQRKHYIDSDVLINSFYQDFNAIFLKNSANQNGEYKPMLYSNLINKFVHIIELIAINMYPFVIELYNPADIKYSTIESKKLYELMDHTKKFTNAGLGERDVFLIEGVKVFPYHDIISQENQYNIRTDDGKRVNNIISEELSVLAKKGDVQELAARLTEIIVLVDIVNDIYFYYQGQVYGFIDELISVMRENEEVVQEEVIINQIVKNVSVLKQPEKLIDIMPKDGEGGVESHTDKNTRLLSSNLDFLFGNLPALFNKVGGLGWFANLDTSSRNHLLLSVCYHRNIVLSPEEFVNLLYVNSFVMDAIKNIGVDEIDQTYNNLLSDAKIYTPHSEPILLEEKSPGMGGGSRGKTIKVKRVRNKLHTRRKNVHISNNNTRKHFKERKRTFTRRKY